MSLRRRANAAGGLLFQRAFTPPCLPHAITFGANGTVHRRPTCNNIHRLSFSYRASWAGGSSHYDTLGVDPDCSPKDIRKGYLRKVKSCHPDLHGDRKTAEFQRLTHAYTVLSDTAKRAKYDANSFRDFEDLSDEEKESEMFRQHLKAMWEQELTWKFMAMRVAPIYTLVYAVAHIVVFVIDIPVNILMSVYRVATSILGG